MSGDTGASESGTLEEMASSGTSVPNDNPTQRIIPSVPNPHQAAESDNILDNPTDISRNPREPGATGEVVTAAGEPMPPSVEKKQGQVEGGNPLAKGSARYDKHTRDKESHLDAEAQASHEVEPAPGEENEDQDTIRERKGA